MRKEMVIYLIKNLVNDKIYIGSTINFNCRKRHHLNTLRNGLHHSILLQRAWDKYGEDNFKFEIIELINDSKELIVREQYFLDYHEPYNLKKGYNICKKAGSTLGRKHSEETKNKMSLTHTGVKTRPCSDEIKNKISETKLNSDLSEAVEKRKKTLLKRGDNIFKIIGDKSSKTQKINGLNKGINNPNSNRNDVLIYNELNEVIFVTNNSEFTKLCNTNELPKRALLKSRNSGGKYKLYLKQKPKNDKFIKYKGWYCKYKI